MEVSIYCPYHEAEERLQFPESYSSEFKGEFPCGGEDERAKLHIELRNWRVANLKVISRPGIVIG